jgi:hypothetical protein
MTYYAGFGPFAIRDHNEEMLREVSKLRLEKGCGRPVNHSPASISLTPCGGCCRCRADI